MLMFARPAMHLKHMMRHNHTCTMQCESCPGRQQIPGLTHAQRAQEVGWEVVDWEGVGAWASIT
jgi:hypothetical protein